MTFEIAPKISRNQLAHRSWAEADLMAMSKDDLLTFQYAHESFGFLVDPGSVVSGAKWIELISRQYDVSEPRIAEMVSVIRKVMLVDQFPNASHHPIADLLDFVEDLPVASKGLLAIPPVGVQQITPELEDLGRVEELTRVLQKRMGYGTLLASGAVNTENLRKGEAKPELVDPIATIKEFVADVVNRGWDPTKESCKLFLARPCPVINPVGAVNSFESILGNFIVWRVPQFYLQSLAESLVEANTVRDVQRG